MSGAATRMLSTSAATCAALILLTPLVAGWGSRAEADPGPGIHAIQHVVMIMQENRSFDSYFGTYPGADGYPMRRGRPAVCVPDPLLRRCVRPFHDSNARNEGGPHGPQNALADIDGGGWTASSGRRSPPRPPWPTASG